MRKIKTNTIYRHFKGDLYLVTDIAINTENDEKMVVYRALYGDYTLYTRPYEIFVSEVDKDKYPNIKQKYKYEEVKIESVRK